VTSDRRGGDLFIVDNSDPGWTGLRYLQEWCDLATTFDIATGYFDTGALLALDGKWQGLHKIRILMGSEITASTKKLLLDTVRATARRTLDEGLEAEKDANPFLNGVPGIVAALRSGQIECRVYNLAKFHAKTYITHAKLEVVGAKALVGSSNFTRPGLTQNVELNIQVQSPGDVQQLQDWFDAHWQKGVEVTDSVLQVIERHAREYGPFDVYAKALDELFRGHEVTDSEWDESQSKMFPRLDRYQKEAYWALTGIARQFGGAFLCDGVGLGKTFVGLMLIERLILHERKRVVLLAPKGAKEAVWDPHLREYLAHIGGVGGSVDFSNLAVFSHTDLSRGGDFPERFRRIAETADAIVIDEAHHFRNPGLRRGGEGGPKDSRYYRLFDLLDPGSHPKSLYLLTATPINNRLTDFRHMVELFSRQDDRYFARTLGVNNLTALISRMEKDLRVELGLEDGDLSDSTVEASERLSESNVFRSLVVQRSRAYAVESQKREKGAAAIFPEREAPRVAEYSVRKTYGKLLDMIEAAFSKEKPLFALPFYYPLAYYKGPDASIDPLEKGRQRQVVGLIRTQFLKRFESSVFAFEISSNRLLRKLLAFVEVHATSDGDRNRLDRWRRQNESVLHAADLRQLSLWGHDEAEAPDEEDIEPDELLPDVRVLSRDEYNVDAIVNETYLDLDQIVRFLAETQQFEPKHDDKLNRLKSLLSSKDLAGRKVLVFSEFADTARYVARELKAAGTEGLAELDSGAKVDRADVIRRFSPYYNRSSSPELKKRGREEIRVLISTDVLSEGLNLQDATRLINYDIHWNPVRLMQRIGRVDRRMSPDVEARLLADHPEQKDGRGKVIFWNFLPPGELNLILSLYRTVTGKILMISTTLGIEGKKLLRPEDDYQALIEFTHNYEGTKTPIEDLHLEYQALIQADPELEAHLAALPGSLFSGRRREGQGVRGVFFCYRLPALDVISGEFSEAAGASRWYSIDLSSGAVLEDPGQIAVSIRSTPSTPRVCEMSEETLLDLRANVRKHIKNSYLKRVDAPMGVEPRLVAWMEVNGE
jgi:superfamily II DNA or RNA helicase